MPTDENPDFLSKQIITCIGNKRKLLPFIGQGVEIAKQRLGRDKLRCADMFSGSGIVARYLKQHSCYLKVNDIEYYSYVINRCFLANRSEIDFEWDQIELHSLSRQIEEFPVNGFITKTYAPKDDNNITADDRCFFTRENAVIIDTARAYKWQTEHTFFHIMGPLLHQVSVHANTSGVFKGFHKDSNGIGKFGGAGEDAVKRITGRIELEHPVLSNFECDVEVSWRDANREVRMKSFPELDLAYLDPPYNQHPYGSNYFMLNLACERGEPNDISKVSGIPSDWNRSQYNKKSAVAESLFSLIDDIPAKFILLSYNSEGFIIPATFQEQLQSRGKLTVFEMPYSVYRGSRNLRDRNLKVTEFLYLLEKN